MNDIRVGRIVRSLRRRLGWRQVDLASRAGVSQQEISLVERGHFDTAPLRIVRSILGALDASTELDVRWRGGALDRLLDDRHAGLVGDSVRRLAVLEWETATEVTYAVYGERGSIDIVARRSDILVVVEVKSELTSIEETLRKHDAKARLARAVVRDRLGWEVRVVARLLVLPGDRTTRRRLERASAVLDRAYPVRGSRATAWLRAPSHEPVALLLLTDTTPSGTGRLRTTPRRCSRAAAVPATPAGTTRDGA